MINIYNKYLNDYIKEKGNLTCYPYLLTFINFASTSNARIDELMNLHDEWKHQMGRNYSHEHRLRCRCECHKFIQYIIDNYQEDRSEGTNPKRKITIHDTIRGLKK